MKQTIRRRFLPGLLVLIALFSIVPARVHAVAGTIYFTPNGGTVIQGSTFTVEIRGNVPRPLFSGGATVGVTYPTALLQATSATSSGGVLGGSNPTINSGTVSFSVFNLFGRAVDNQMIFKITFKALATGNATLNFTSNTNINDGPTTKTPSTFIVQAASCPAGQIGTPPNCTTPPQPSPSPSPTPSPSSSPTPTTTPRPSTTPRPATTPTPTASPAPTAIPAPTIEELPAPVVQSDGGLKIENVKIVTNRQKNSVSWTINKDDAEPKLTYGTTKGNLTSEATIEKQEDGGYEAVFSDLKPGTMYYFAIKAATPDQLQGANYSGTLTTRGYPVQLTIQQNGVLAPNAKVKIGDRTFVANKDAIITTELGDGQYDAVITPVGAPEALTIGFTVQKKPIPANGSPELQAFTLNAAIDGSGAAPDDRLALVIAGSAAAALAGLAALVGFLLIRRRRQTTETPSVDTDLLTASYGPSFTEYRANTPEPNLETQAQIAPSVATTQMVTPAVEGAPPSYNPLSPLPEAPQTLQPDLGPESLPLPPTESLVTSSIDPTLPPAAADIPQAVDELSQQMMAVESVEATSPSLSPETTGDNEETAVFDEKTGELDIIHHSGAHHHGETPAVSPKTPPSVASQGAA